MEYSRIRLLSRRVPAFVLAAALAVAAQGCSDDDDDGGTGLVAPPTQVTINIVDFAFNPRVDTVAVGGTVTWTNTGNAPHTSTSTASPALWDSGTLNNGQSFPRQFSTAGSFQYDCTIHPNMTGTIVVR